MSVKEEILKMFEGSRGDFFSGGELASKLGVSRNAIWKAVRQLEREGYQFEAVSGRGYALRRESDVISAQGIKKYLGRTAGNPDIKVYRTITSTNTVLKEMASEGAAEGVVVHQSVANTMEHACWGWRSGIAQLSHLAIDATRIGYHGGGTESRGKCVGCGHSVGTAVVGLKYGDGTCTAARQDDAGGVDMQLIGMGAEVGNGRRAVLNSIADGRVESGIGIENIHLGRIFEVEAIVDCHGHEPPFRQQFAAFNR